VEPGGEVIPIACRRFIPARNPYLLAVRFYPLLFYLPIFYGEALMPFAIRMNCGGLSFDGALIVSSIEVF
jgi:hypothetical protein